MSYANLMVHVHPGRSNAALLQIAEDMASRFNSQVIGIAACQPLHSYFGESTLNAEVIDTDRKRVAALLHAAEQEFRTAIAPQGEALQWRSSVSMLPIANYVAHEACSADLIITSAGISSPGDRTRRAATSDLVMQAGRPVLVVPDHITSLQLQRVVVFWKNSRESRRAIADALPLLQKATHVAVVSLAAESEMLASRLHLDTVVDWLKRHGVECWSGVTKTGTYDVTQLATIAKEQKADLIVAGAYGHSRLHEWALGGVTRDLLMHADRCALLSH